MNIAQSDMIKSIHSIPEEEIPSLFHIDTLFYHPTKFENKSQMNNSKILY
jgi:hypothetical protein